MSLGLAQSGSEAALDAVLPNGTDRFIALLTTLPSDVAGTGLVEATVAGYARIAHDAWANATASNKTTRSNSSAITFAALTEDLPDVVGWGIFDALTVGTLLAFGETVDAADIPISVDFVATNEPRFAIGELELFLQVSF